MGCFVGVGSHECDFPCSHVEHLPTLTSSTISFTTSSDVDRQVREHLETGQGLYSVDAGVLSSLKPDVIVTQSLCKVCSVDFCLVEKLALDMECQPRVVDTNPQDLWEVLRDVERVGKAIGLEEDAGRVRRKFEGRIERVVRYVQDKVRDRPKVVMMEWTDPIFIGGHWTPQMIHIAGGEHGLNLPVSIRKSSTSDTRTNSINESQNLFTKKGESFSLLGGFSHAGKSFPVSSTTFADYDPELIIIAPCGLNLEAAEREAKLLYDQKDSNGNHWFRDLRAVQEGNVVVVDGDAMFNRPGPRLVDALEWLVGILHPQIEAARILQENSFPSKFLTF